MAAPLTTVRVATNQPVAKTARLSVNVPRTNAAYHPASPNPLYTVPLAARIIRTHQTTQSGTVNAIMNMSVRYQ